MSATRRAILVRDCVPVEDLVNNLPRHMLMELMFDSAQALGVASLRINGKFGEIEGSPADKVIFRRYAFTGAWSPKFQSEIIERAFAHGLGTFVDVGANIGLTSIPAARHVSACIAVEPDPINFCLLQRNVAINGLAKQVSCLNIAAYDEASTLDFELSPDNLGDHRIRPRNVAHLVRSEQQEDSRRVIQVNALPLDSVVTAAVLRHPVVVKIDTQGSEPTVLRGAHKLLMETDCIVIEFSPYLLGRFGFGPQHFFEYLSRFSHGYVLSLDQPDAGSELSIDKSPLLTFDQIVAHCTAAAANMHPDNYFDVVLLRHPGLLTPSPR